MPKTHVLSAANKVMGACIKTFVDRDGDLLAMCVDGARVSVTDIARYDAIPQECLGKAR